MSDKKLLVVSTSFPKSPGDALSPFVWEFCKNLHLRGWNVTALVPHHPDLPDGEVWNSVNIRRFRYLPERFENLGYSGGILPNLRQKPLRLFKIPFYIYAMYQEALDIAVRERIDIVNFHWLFPASFFLGQFIRSSGVPVVMTGHGTDILLAVKGTFKFFADRALSKTDALTVNSEYMKSILQGNKLPSRVEIIPMGVDTDMFTPGAAKPSHSRTVLYVGRLIKQKGVDLLADAFIDVAKNIPDARLEIIGYGPEKESIKKLIDSQGLGDSISMVEMVPHSELAAIYRRSRVLVLPALIPEGLGMAPAEAGLCGVPTITFGLGGTRELIKNGETGIIIEPRKEALAEALAKLLEDDRLADTMGENARNHLVLKIGWENIAKSFDSLFTGIIKSKSESKAMLSIGRALASALAIASVTIGYVVKLSIDRMDRILSLFK